VDWYRIIVSHHGELKVTVGNVPSTLDIQFRVWNQERDVITKYLDKSSSTIYAA